MASAGLTSVENDGQEGEESNVGSAAARAWLILALLIATALFAFVDRQVLSLLTEQVARSLSLRDTQIGLIQGLGSALFAIFATYPLGYLTDRMDRRWVLSGCVLIWSIGTVACGLAQGFWSLFFAVMAICTGEAGLPPLAYSVIPELFVGRRRVLANQIFYIALILSSALGIGFSGMASLALEHLQGSLPVALQHLEPWRTVFFFVAAPAPLLIVLIAFGGLGVRRSTVVASAEDKPTTDFGRFLREEAKVVALTIAGLAVSGLPFLAILVWTPAALTRLFSLAPSENGFGMGAALGIGCLGGVAIASLLQRRYRDRMGGGIQLRLSCMALIVSLPMAILYAVASNPIITLAAATLLMGTGTFNGSMIPNILQGLAPPAMRGRVVALYGVLQMFVEGLGVSIVGPLAGVYSGNPRGLMIGVATLIVFSWLAAAFLFRLAESPYARLQTRLETVNREVEAV